MQRGYSHEEASEITDEVIYETNTTYEDVEPIWDVIRMLIEKICTEKETPPTDGPSTEHVKLVG